jgi:uncharacterized protein
LDQRFKFETIECEFRLKKEGDIILLIGRYHTVIHTMCDRCLSPVSFKLDQEFELDLMADSTYVEPEGDLEIRLDSKDTEIFQGQELNITRYFEDQLILDLPFSVACEDRCKGICTQCGANKNESDCDCEKKSINNPFAVLSELDLDIEK